MEEQDAGVQGSSEHLGDQGRCGVLSVLYRTDQ